MKDILTDIKIKGENMGKTTIESYELGNMVFGNSRGPFEFPDRELVNCDEWSYLLNHLLQMDNHGIMSDYYYDYERQENRKRDNGLEPSKSDGYICKDETGSIIFEIFPYYWDECSCGADQYNTSLEEELKNEFFSAEERKTYESFDEWCKDECPACIWKPENEGKSLEYLQGICTCNTVNENIKLMKRKELIADKAKKFEAKYNELYKEHTSDCLLMKHNFIFKPGTSEEFWIDWYKYPFRDSYMSKDATIDEIKKIWLECQCAVKKDIEKNSRNQ